MTPPWQGSRRAEGWLGRHGAVALFRAMSGQCADVASALERHADLDAIEIFARLAARMAEASKLAVFPRARSPRAPARGRSLRLVGGA